MLESIKPEKTKNALWDFQNYKYKKLKTTFLSHFFTYYRFWQTVTQNVPFDVQHQLVFTILNFGGNVPKYGQNNRVILNLWYPSFF